MEKRLGALEEAMEATRSELREFGKLCVNSSRSFMAFQDQFQDLAQECRMLCSVLREIGLLSQWDLRRNRHAHMFIRLFEDLNIANCIMLAGGDETARSLSAVSPACIDAIVSHAIRAPQFVVTRARSLVHNRNNCNDLWLPPEGAEDSPRPPPTGRDLWQPPEDTEDDLQPPPMAEDVPEDLQPPPMAEDVPDDLQPPPMAEDVPDDLQPPPTAEDVPDDLQPPPTAEDVPDDLQPPPMAEDVPDDLQPPPMAEDVPNDRQPPPMAEDVPHDPRPLATSGTMLRDWTSASLPSIANAARARRAARAGGRVFEGQIRFFEMVSSMPLGPKLTETVEVGLNSGAFTTPRGMHWLGDDCSPADPVEQLGDALALAEDMEAFAQAAKAHLIAPAPKPPCLDESPALETPQESFSGSLLALLQDVWQCATLAESFTSVMEVSTILAFRTVSRAGRECMRLFGLGSTRSVLPGLRRDPFTQLPGEESAPPAFRQRAAAEPPALQDVALPEFQQRTEGEPPALQDSAAWEGSQRWSSSRIVKLQGLRSRPELNGMLGKLLAPLDKSRGMVLLSSGERICVRRDNLRVVSSKKSLRPGGTPERATARAPQTQQPAIALYPASVPPIPVVSHGFKALLKSAVYMCGGKGRRGVSRRVNYFVPDSFSWYTVEAMGAARVDASVATLDGCLYVMGGFNDESFSLGSAECFHLQAGRWEPLPDMLHDRGSACATVLGSDIYVGGGCTVCRSASATIIATLPCFDRFSTLARTWEALEDMKRPRERAPMVVLGGNIYICGGKTYQGEVVGSVERFSTEQMTWTGEFALPWECAMGAHCVHKGYIYLCGGGNRVRAMAHAIRFKHTTGTWEYLPQMNYARLGAVAVATPEGDIFICGGCGTAVVECYKPQLAAWVLVEGMFTLHTYPSAVTLGEHLYILGGTDKSDAVDVAERMTISTGKWEKLPPMPTALAGCAIASLHP